MELVILDDISSTKTTQVLILHFYHFENLPYSHKAEVSLPRDETCDDSLGQALWEIQ